MADSEPTVALWAVLKEGAVERERQMARWGQAICLVALVVALVFAVAVDGTVGGSLALLVMLLFGYFTAASELLERGLYTNVLRWLDPTVEMCVPAATIWLLMMVEGPRYTLGSWVPPQLFCVFIASSIFRLIPWLPALLGAISAAQWSALYWGWILPSLGNDAAMLHRPSVQVVRTGTLLLLGIAASGAVYALRQTIVVASQHARGRELFGKYRLDREIASGGMGKVIDATYCPEGGFSRRVAIKLIHPHLASDPTLAERFRTEAAISSRLVHPHIVQPLDFGRVDDRLFFAMEYVDGLALSVVLNAARHRALVLDPGIAIAIGQQVAGALHFAHAEARDAEGHRMCVLHRDLSPSNILVERVGIVKISDFGVARAVYAARQLHTDTLVGKPSYMAPEQLNGGSVDARSDLWSLAVVLYEILVGDRLFFREVPEASMNAVLHDPIRPVLEARPDLSPGWGSFFAKALDRDPEGRYPDAYAFAVALGALGTPSSPEDVALLVAQSDDVPELELDPTTAFGDG